jgi:hypothetical protein
MKTIFHPLIVLLAKLTDPVVARQLKQQARELDNKPLNAAEPDDDVPPLTSVRRRSWLGGLLKSYSRKTA